jgi:hypothetical protein
MDVLRGWEASEAKGRVKYKSKFHFLPYSCTFVTHFTKFSRTFTKMSQLGDFKHGFTPILLFAWLLLDRICILRQCCVTKYVKFKARH